MSAQPDSDTCAFPLAVDLDDTLLKVDTLYENVAYNLFRQPVRTLHALTGLVGGKAAMKDRLSKLDLPDASTLPRDPDFIDYLRTQHKNGRPIHLVTAAHQTMATLIANEIGVFASAHGTDDQNNLKGPRKAEFLQTTFPDGFVYAGDSSADLHVWRKAKAAILVGVSDTTRQTVEAEGIDVETTFKGTISNHMVAWFRALALHRWAVLLAALIAFLMISGAGASSLFLTGLIGFLSLGCVASGTHIMKELASLETDRKTMSRRDRPFASGTIPVRDGLIGSVLLLGAGIVGALLVLMILNGVGG